MKEHVGQLIVGVILLLVGAAVSYFIFRPSPLAFARCEPLQGDAPLNVRCDNESIYHRHVIWDFGDHGSPQIKDEDRAEYRYQKVGQYTITLTAHGQGTPSQWTQLIDVLTTTALADPIYATIIARTKESQIIKTKAFKVSRTKDDHPSVLSEHSRNYTETFSAEPGFRIIDATFRQSSATRAGDIKQNISLNGQRIEFSYRLTSGPSVDRYRAWLRGDLIVKQEHLEPATHVTLGSEVNISRFGTYALPVSVALDTIETVSILGQDGRLLAFGEPNEVFVSQEKGLMFSSKETAGQVFLKVEPVN